MFDKKEFFSEIEDEQVLDLGIDIEDDEFRVLNKSQADFFIRKIADLEEENKEITEWCDSEVKKFAEKYELYKTKQVDQNNRLIEYFKGLLMQFADAELEKDGKKRSVKLPHGTLAYRKTKDKLIIDNQDSLMEALKNVDPSLIKETIKYSIDKTGVKNSLEQREDGYYINGTRMPGVTIEKSKDTFSINLSKE